MYAVHITDDDGSISLVGPFRSLEIAEKYKDHYAYIEGADVRVVVLEKPPKIVSKRRPEVTS